MRVVLDTNVLISACWKPGGLEDRTAALAISGAVIPCVSPQIWAEYADVLSRKKFAALRPRSTPMLTALGLRAVLVYPAATVQAATDPEDNRFLECAAEANAAYLVTGNLRHFPSKWGDTAVVNARQFLEAMAGTLGANMNSPSKVALVTGAGSGIGRAVSLALQTAGFSVVLAGRRASELEGTAAQASSTGGRMLPVPADVGRPESVDALFARIRETFGRLDLLFNNAGMGAPPVPIDDLTSEQWNAVVSVNLTGSFLCAQHAIRMMKAQDPQGGRIINNGSISAHAPRPNSAPYTATKHAITGLTKSISLDCRPFHIACGQIDIGNAATEMTERMTAGVPQANGTTMVEPRMDVRHVADAVLFMANLPLDANVQFVTVMATAMPFVGRG